MLHLRPSHLRHALLAVALLLSPTLALAQGQGNAKRGDGPRRINSVALLIDARDDLKLTSDQLVKFDSLQKVLAERNRPLMVRMQATRDSLFSGNGTSRRSPRDLSAQDREKMKAGMAAMRPIMDEMRKNDVEIRTAAESLLDGNQKLVARDLLAKHQERSRERMGKLRGRQSGDRQSFRTR